jgi:GT2 family glycosyltransferase
MKKVAVVILNWNGRDFLEKFLPSVTSHSKNDNTDVYVADNGSTDTSIEFLKENYPQIKIIELPVNYGFAGGYNEALKHVEAEYYIILNSDVEVTENWIESVIEYMDKNPNVAACQPKILAYHDKNKFEHAGAAGGFIDKFGYPFCQGRIFDKLENDENQYDEIKSIFWATGACLFIRAELFKKLDGFDNDFFAHMEEIDLCWRLKNRGYEIKYIPTSKVYHVGGGTLPNNNPHKIYLNFRNNLFLLYKNLPTSKFHRTMLIRMILDGIAFLKFFFGLEIKQSFAVFKAHVSYYKMLSLYREKRKKLLEFNNKSQQTEIYPKSIVNSYYLKGTYTFDKLHF